MVEAHTRTLSSFLTTAPYMLRQSILGTAYLLMPRQLPGLLPLAAVTMRDLPYIASAQHGDPARALDNPDGGCAGSPGRIRDLFQRAHVAQHSD